MLTALNSGKHLLQDDNGNYYAVSKFFAGEQYHPMIMRDNNIGKNSGFNVNGSVYADFKPFKGFTFTSRSVTALSGTVALQQTFLSMAMPRKAVTMSVKVILRQLLFIISGRTLPII